MLKPTVLKLILSAVLGAGFYFVASNSHLDAFPCDEALWSFQTNSLRPVQHDTCSLMTIKRSGTGPAADYAKLTGGGYAMMVLLFGVLPYFAGAGIGHLATRRRRRAAVGAPIRAR